jgi:hypothetical protein
MGGSNRKPAQHGVGEVQKGAADAPARRRLCAALGVTLAGGSAAWLAGCGESGTDGGEPAPLRLAMDLWPGYYPVLLAEDLGWFAEDRVRLKVSFPANTDRMMADYAAGQVDVIAVALGDLSHSQPRRPDSTACAGRVTAGWGFQPFLRCSATTLV